MNSKDKYKDVYEDEYEDVWATGVTGPVCLCTEANRS